MKIPLSTFNKLYNSALTSFGESVYLFIHKWVNGIPGKQEVRGQRMLFLYLYALSSWEQDEHGNYEHKTNFLTEKQLGAIISRVKELS